MKKNNYIRNIILALLTFFIIIYFNKNKFRIIYHNILDLLIFKDNLFINKSKYAQELNRYKCLPERIKFLPKNSSLIIGHAYGRVGRRKYSKGISPSIKKFITLNRESIKTIFFTGDVFNNPTIKKWSDLYKTFQDDIEVFIAPGNHDVGSIKENIRRSIFESYVLKKQPNYFPFYLERSGFNIIVDDSSMSNSILEKTLFDQYRFEGKDKILILRHHNVIEELQNVSGYSPKFYRKDFLENKFKSNNKVTIVSGNGGMYVDQPRISCFEHNNFLHIVNGIGEIKNDNILVLHNSKIYRYEINMKVNKK